MECGRIQGLSKFFEYPVLSQELVKLRTSNLADVFTGSMRTKVLYFGKIGSVDESRDSPNFWSTPYYLRNGNNYKLQIWQVYSQGESEQKPFKILGENGAWAYPGTTPIFWVPPIKATNFKFCTHILSIDRNKSPLQISGEKAGCVVRTLKTVKGTHILGASRGLLCDSSAVLSKHF